QIFFWIDLDPGLHNNYAPQNHEDYDGDDTQTQPPSPTRRTTLFFDLLDQTPEIAFYVQDFDLYIYLEDFDCPKTIRVLNMLSNLTAFSLHHDNSDQQDFSLNWDGLSPQFISCIHRIISSPKLTQLEFGSIISFPLSTFSWCGGIEELSFWSVELSPGGSIPTEMTPIRLRALSCNESGMSLVGQTLIIKSEHPILDLTRLDHFFESLLEAGGNICMREILSSSEALAEVDLYGTTHTYRGIGQSIASRSLNTIQSFQLTLFTNFPDHNTIHAI
ncbi:hypothetical protein K443DRAFT_284713, partial [Laccaria amethystina LaAM-08-1]